MKIAKLSRHTEWLSLIEVSGPFLAVSTLEKAFPQGLEVVETPRRQKLRAAYEEWCEAVDREDKLLPALHQEWVHLVLTEMLEYDYESLVSIDNWPDSLPGVSSQENAGTFKPDWIVRSPADGNLCLFIAVLPPDTDLESVQRGDGWPVSLQERMTLLCRAHGVRVGFLTNGERWMLVNAPVGSTSGQASWYARLWFQEPITLKAFQSLLGVRRCFGPADDTLESLLDESLKHHEEVTDTLGEQVRRAVEVLVQCLDKADEDRNRELLRDVKPAELYEAGLTVMMRLVFVLCAEERGLLLLGDSVYDQSYAISTLRGQLAEDAERYGPEVLDRRYDAWARLLAVFRAVYGGMEHENLRMPALGGSLFAPDRFPFLEGRNKGSSWRDTSAAPLPIDNRTVLLLLSSLQILEQSGGALLLSYRALDVEQIGHVYEGLLEHTVVRVPRATLGLLGSKKAKNPNVPLAELESARLEGEEILAKLILGVTKLSESTIRKALSKPTDDTIFGKVSGVCGGNATLAERIRPFANLLRTDAWGDPIVYRDNSFMVTLGADRRETGTHYTPKSLTESIVTTTLEPVVYVGPADGKPRGEWILKSSREILDLKICDPAMGSGAFLVQACRYIGERLVEAWSHEEATGKAITVDGEILEQLGAEEPLPSQLDERLTIARRLMAERCLYGVDTNPLAVELAKLSIWLVTLAKGRPFGFLDHNLRSGDSLLGLHRLEQLTQLRMDTKSGQPRQLRIFGQNIEATVNEAIELRKQLRATTIRDIKDVEAMARLDREARKKLESVELIADAMIGEALRCGENTRALNTALDTLTTMAGDYLSGNEKMGEQIALQTKANLAIDLPEDKLNRKPFHWVFGFPEISESHGFNATVGNPPFMRGHDISGRLGKHYREYLSTQLMQENVGIADLCSFFIRRASSILQVGGLSGFIATNSISEGDSRRISLENLLERGFQIIWAFPNMKWPGKAAVIVSPFVVCNGDWNAPCSIGSENVEFINATLSTGARGKPEGLDQNKGKCFGGSYILGDGFIIDSGLADSFRGGNPSAEQVILPYINGVELNSFPKEIPRRSVICFWDWPIEKAQEYTVIFGHLEQTVKTERSTVARDRYRRLWWLHAENRPGFYHAIGMGKRFIRHPKGWKESSPTMRKVLVKAKTSDSWGFLLYPSEMVFDQAVTVIASESMEMFAILQSSIHECWARYSGAGSSMKTDLRYSPAVFETFPFPSLGNINLEKAGEEYYRIRASIMLELDIGLTKIIHLINNPDNHSDAICALRNASSEIDNELLSQYGWKDLNLKHNFHKVGKHVRFGLPPNALEEVLRRLLNLNYKFSRLRDNAE